jgi:hypothetical protein
MKFAAAFNFVSLMVMASLAIAGTLETVLVPDQNIKTPQFEEGEVLGAGVIEKEFIPEASAKAVKVSPKKVPLKSFAHSKGKTPDRSIASFQEDTRFSNEALSSVREKDQKDREESLTLVRAAILRGEFGKAAKENLLRQK